MGLWLFSDQIVTNSIDGMISSSHMVFTQVCVFVDASMVQKDSVFAVSIRDKYCMFQILHFGSRVDLLHYSRKGHDTTTFNVKQSLYIF